MRLMLAGDTHGQTAHVDYLLRTAASAECDRVFVVGDFGYWEHEHDGRVYLDKVDRLANRYGVDVAFLDGNHDNLALLLRSYNERDADGLVVVRPHVRYAPRGHRWTWGSTRLLALGGAASLDKQWRLDAEAKRTGKAARKARYRDRSLPPAPVRSYAETLWFPGEELTDAQAAAAAADGSLVHLLLCHDKPRASRPEWNRKDTPAAWPNQDRVQRVVDALRPARVVHGHLHVRYTNVLADGTVVDGLACDHVAGAAVPGYRREDSWLLVDL